MNSFWSEVTTALSEIFQVDAPKCPELCILGDKIHGLSVREMRFITFGCLAAKCNIVMNWKIPTPSCFCLSSWLEEFIDLLGVERAATTLWQFKPGLGGLWETIRAYLNALPGDVYWYRLYFPPSSLSIKGMYFLRRLRLNGVNCKLLLLFYQALLESVVLYGIQVWYKNLSAQLKSELINLIKEALKNTGAYEPNFLQSLYEKSVLREAQKILDDPTHILSPEFERLPSG